jgi:hypothetical protein
MMLFNIPVMHVVIYLPNLASAVDIYIVLFNIIHIVIYISNLELGVDVGAPAVSVSPEGDRESCLHLYGAI